MFQYAFLITMIPIKPIFTKDEKAIGIKIFGKWKLGTKEDCKSLVNDIRSYGIDTEVIGHLK